MTDPGTSQERYCSSYYDKHGLYNDGFPCPNDKYCCQTSEGTKMCCPLNQLQSNLNSKLFQNSKFYHSSVSSQSSSSSSSYLLTTLSNNFIVDYNKRINHLNNNNFKSPSINNNLNNQNLLVSSNTLSSNSSLYTFLISNSTLLISICISLTILVILSILIFICICRCVSTKKYTSKSSSNGTRVSSKSTTNHNYQFKKNIDRKSSTSSYSRNSNSTCSTGTSSASTSPKTNQLTICCDEDLVDEHHKILSIDPRQMSNQTHRNQTAPLSNTDLMQKSLLNQNLVNLLTNNTFMIGNQNSSVLTKPAYSSGASSVALLHSHMNSANTTQTSFVTNTNTGQQNFADLADFCMNEEDDETDFIVSTSSNLEFLKTHSLFNSTPLNYYPSLNKNNNNNNNNNNGNKMNVIDEPPPYTPNHNHENVNHNQIGQAGNNQLNANIVDLRFSTFLPPLFVKNSNSNIESV